MTHIVKRQPGHSEPFDAKKLYDSIVSSCLSVRTPIGEAELTAERICKDMVPWLERKLEVTSADIRRKAAEHFHAYNPEAAYLYKHQRLIA